MTSRAARDGRLLGYIESVSAASLWGSSGVFAVHLFRLGVPPETVAVLRPLMGAAFLFAGFALLDRSALRIDTRGLLILGLGGGAAVGAFQLAYLISTDAVGVPTTVALLYVAPAIVTAAAGPVLGEWPSRRRVAILALTLAGVWLSVLGARDVQTTFGASGLWWGALAAVAYATYTLFGRYFSPRYGAAKTVLYSTLGACVVLTLFAPLGTGRMAAPSGLEAWLLLLAFGGLTIALAQFLFFDALRRIEASGASIATAAEPVVAAILASILLSQGLSPVGWLGIALVVTGVVGVGLSARAEAG